jgi:hypothetical protein
MTGPNDLETRLASYFVGREGRRATLVGLTGPANVFDCAHGFLRQADWSSRDRGLRAVAIVREDDVGTGHQYSDPLLLCSAKEYFATPFDALLVRLRDALRGERPRLLCEAYQPDGSTRVFFVDGSSITVPAPPAR